MSLITALTGTECEVPIASGNVRFRGMKRTQRRHRRDDAIDPVQTLCVPEEQWTAFHEFGADARHIAVITCAVQRLPIDNGPNRRVDIGIPRQRVVAR